MKTASFLMFALFSFASSSFAADRGFTCIEDKNWLGHLASGSKSGVILVAAPEADQGQYSVTVSADGQTVATIAGGSFTGSAQNVGFFAENQGELGIEVASVIPFLGEDELRNGPEQKGFTFDIEKPHGSTPLFATERLTMTCNLN